MSLFKVVCVVTICGAIVVALGAVNIWLGILSLPILYSISESFLE